MKWEKVKLGNVCEITSSKRIFYSEYVDDGVPFYRSKEIIESDEGKVIENPLYISVDKYNEIKEKFGVPQTGDMLLTSVGTIGIPYIIKKKDRFYFKDGNLTWFRDFREGLNSKYLYYWIKSSEGTGILYNTTIGSSQKALTISALKNIKVSLPPRSVQDKIVEVVSAYDDLIENNQKQIKLLEEAAQRLYKEWFVDLRFPGHENTKIVDGVPEGWSKSTVGNICKLRKVVITPDKIESNTPYIGLEHMPRNDICLSTWGKSEEINSNKFIYLKKDVLFGKIRPYFHKVGFALNDGITSTDTMVMVADQNLWGLLLVTVSSDAFVDFSYQNCKEGAKMPRADWKQMEKYAIMIADQATQKLFEQEILVITNKISALAFQCRSLREARDRMLPKLMGGEVEA